MRSRLYRFVGAAAALVVVAGCSSPRPAQKAAATPPEPVPVSNPLRPNGPDLQLSEAGERRSQANAHFAAGVSYELQEEGEKALNEFYQAALTDPANELIVSDVVRRLMQAKDYDKVQDLLNKATALPDASAGVFALKGAALAEAGKTDEAVVANRTAIRKEPTDISAYRNLFQLYLQKEKKKEAQEIVDEAAARPDGDSTFLTDVVDLYGTLLRLHPTELTVVKPKLLKLLDRAMQLKPKQPVMLQKLADGYRSVSEFAKATAIYADLLEHYPDLPSLREKLTDVYLQSGDRQKATEQLQAMIRDNPTRYPQAYFILGLIYREMDKLKEAAEQFQSAIIVRPNFEPVYYELAGVQVSMGKPEDALATISKAADNFPRKFLQEYYRAMAYLRMEKYDKAVEHLNAAEVIGRANEPDRLTAVFYHQLGSACERNKEYAQAEKYFEKSLELDADFAESLNYLGYMWAERGEKLDRAYEMIDKALKLEPKNAAYLDSMGWVLYKLNRHKEALDFQLKALELSPKPDATLLDHLGDIYAGLKDYAHARDAWEKSLKIESNADIKKKLEAAPGK